MQVNVQLLIPTPILYGALQMFDFSRWYQISESTLSLVYF